MTTILITTLITLTVLTAGLLALAVVLDVAGERRQAPWRASAALRLRRRRARARLLATLTGVPAEYQRALSAPRRGHVYRSEFARPAAACPPRHARGPA